MAKETHIETNRTEWSSVWEKEDILRWDYLSQVLHNEMKSIVWDFKSKDIAELGSGSGRVSKVISQEGGRVTLLDMAEGVLRRSREIFSNESTSGHFVVGAFPEIPIKRKRFDVVWNAGVIEHFDKAVLNKSILEMLSLCRDGGIVITMNPSGRAVLHTVGEGFMKIFKSFPYKDERPFRSLKGTVSGLPAHVKIEEHTSGFFLLFVGMFKRLAVFSYMRNISTGIFWFLSDLFCLVDTSSVGPIFRSVDRFLSNIFGGYLLVSVFTSSKTAEGK